MSQLGVPVPSDAPTPSFIIVEQTVRSNLKAAITAAGSASRFMPHLKTHRAPWLTQWLVSQGVKSCKVATPAEAELALSSGMQTVLWAYPTVNPANISRFVANARLYPAAQLTALVDSAAGLDVWRAALDQDQPSNLALRVDLDPGMGRTGVTIGEAALELARNLHRHGLFAGWHVYDGHIKALDQNIRRQKLVPVAAALAELRATLAAEGIASDVVAGTSYTFDLWDAADAAYVCSGSWTYSSNQHDIELVDAGWAPAAFVLATVISTRNGTATLDAGSKAISPDKPVAERFYWNGKIILMNEEHTVVEATDLQVGDRVLLTPQHACTSAYLYDEALVLTVNGVWERRAQLASKR
jgi:D-serine deaminase-like pyridoxal phosphate-dependent protein